MQPAHEIAETASRNHLSDEDTTCFNVHVFTEVRVKVSNVRAVSAQQAIEIAQDRIDLHDLCTSTQISESNKHYLGDGMAVENVEWTEGAPICLLVDPLLDGGEIDYNASCFFGPDGKKLIDNELPNNLRESDGASAIMCEKTDELKNPVAIQIYGRVLEAMQDAEEMGGPEGEDYIALMTAILLEAKNRTAISHRAGASDGMLGHSRLEELAGK